MVGHSLYSYLSNRCLIYSQRFCQKLLGEVPDRKKFFFSWNVQFICEFERQIFQRLSVTNFLHSHRFARNCWEDVADRKNFSFRGKYSLYANLNDRLFRDFPWQIFFTLIVLPEVAERMSPIEIFFSWGVQFICESERQIFQSLSMKNLFTLSRL